MAMKSKKALQPKFINGEKRFCASEECKAELLKPDVSRITSPLDTRVWRYMKLEYFKQYVKDRHLYVPRVDMLGEPLEGSFCTPAGSDEHAEFRKGFMQQTFYVSCWHIAEHESDMMWGRYLQKFDGVAIHTTIGELLKFQPAAFEWQGYEVIPAPLVGNVQYVEHAALGAFPANDCSLFYKDLAFNGDKEFRLIFKFWSYELQWARLSERPEGIKIELVPDHINGVVLKSGTQPEVLRSVKDIAESANQKLSVVRSRLGRSGHW
jgi:hypothetical protein